MEDKPDPLLDISHDGLVCFQDETDGHYEAMDFLGDVYPVCQVFTAKYTRKVGDQIIGDPQVVALKLARVNLVSPEFIKIWQQAESSFTIGANDGQENKVISANSRILGIYNWFIYADYFCVSMPYLRGGSLRYVINGRFFQRTMPETCIAVVLRETLLALSVLHARGETHTKLNAGNIFIDDFHSPQPAIKLAYEGSTYFHDPETTCPKQIWYPSSGLGYLVCSVSRLPENRFWTEPGTYEPSINEQEDFTPASDIWNVGVTALELALGPLRHYNGPRRTPEELRTFLINLRNNDAAELPTLFQLFISPPTAADTDTTSTSATSGTSTSTSTAGKMRKDTFGKGRSVVTLMKKVAEKFPIVKTKPPKSRMVGKFSMSFTAMVKRCLVLDPNERPTAEMLLHDPFFLEHQNVGMQFFAQILRNQELINRKHD